MKQIFFINPDVKLVQIYEPYLKKHFNVDSAHDGLTAMRKIQLSHPNLIISDYYLPLISGLSLLKFVRGHAKLFPVPFIFLTEHDNPQEALNRGANDWLPRKFGSPDLLLEKIYYHLKQSHGLQIH